MADITVQGGNIRVRRDSLDNFQAGNRVYAEGEPLNVVDAAHNDWLTADGVRDFNTLWSDVNTLPNRAKASADAAASSAAAAALAAASGAQRGGAFLGLATALRDGNQSFAVQATGDSTTVPDTAWFRLLANTYSVKFPKLAHQYRKWNEGLSDFDPPIALTSPSGTRRALVVAAGTANQRSGPQLAGPNITGDLDVRVNLRMPSYAPGETQAIAGKWTNDASRSWLFLIGPTGLLRYNWFAADGTTIGDKQATVALTAPDNTDLWVRVVHDIDNGASGNDVKFYTSTDGATWTPVGSTITSSGTTAITPSTSRYTLGKRGSNALTAGTRLYEVQVRDGIGGPNLVPHLPEHWARSIGAYEPTLEGTPVVTWLMAGRSGGGLGYDYNTPIDSPPGTTAYYLTQYQRQMSPNFGQLATFFSTGHNEYNSGGALWAARLGAWVSAVTADKPLTSRVVLTQNPRVESVAEPDGHKKRRAQTLAWGRQFPGVDVIDTYQAFLADGRPLNVLVNPADGVHPTGTGYQVWAAAIQVEIDAALSRVAATPFQ